MAGGREESEGEGGSRKERSMGWGPFGGALVLFTVARPFFLFFVFPLCNIDDIHVTSEIFLNYCCNG